MEMNATTCNGPSASCLIIWATVTISHITLAAHTPPQNRWTFLPVQTHLDLMALKATVPTPAQVGPHSLWPELHAGTHALQGNSCAGAHSHHPPPAICLSWASFLQCVLRLPQVAAAGKASQPLGPPGGAGNWHPAAQSAATGPAPGHKLQGAGHALGPALPLHTSD